MASNIERYGTGMRGMAARDSRQLSRSLAGVSGWRELRQADVDAQTDVTMNKIDNVTLATGAAMQAVVNVTKAQEAFEQMCPSASGRLSMIAEAHTLGMADELALLRHRVRRI